jgi:hypothetical protein
VNQVFQSVGHHKRSRIDPILIAFFNFQALLLENIINFLFDAG